MKEWKKILNQKAFTLIEMVIVLMIISILLLIAIPNMTKNNAIAHEKGCQATIDLLQTQVGAYQIEYGTLPANITVLETENYVETTRCPNGQQLTLTPTGKVIKE